MIRYYDIEYKEGVEYKTIKRIKEDQQTDNLAKELKKLSQDVEVVNVKLNTETLAKYRIILTDNAETHVSDIAIEMELGFDVVYQIALEVLKDYQMRSNSSAYLERIIRI